MEVQEIHLQPDTHKIRVWFDQMSDPEQLAAQALEARSDPERRSARLTELLAATPFGSEEGDSHSLLDEVISRATDPAAVHAINRAREMSARVVGEEKRSVGDRFFDVVVGAANGDVEDVSVGTIIETDAELESRAKDAADSTGWGPKQNRTSFRTRRTDPGSRR